MKEFRKTIEIAMSSGYNAVYVQGPLMASKASTLSTSSWPGFDFGQASLCLLMNFFLTLAESQPARSCLEL